MPGHAVTYGRLSLRNITSTDYPFLLIIYRSTRETEFELLGWSEEQKQLFVETQFQAQHQHYQTHYPDASFDLILYKGEAIGRLYLEECCSELRIIDITLAPQYRQRGIGSWFLRGILQKAVVTEKSVLMHVEQSNPALRLYQRLGFEKLSDQGIYYLMKWQTDNAKKTISVF